MRGKIRKLLQINFDENTLKEKQRLIKKVALRTGFKSSLSERIFIYIISVILLTVAVYYRESEQLITLVTGSIALIFVLGYDIRIIRLRSYYNKTLRVEYMRRFDVSLDNEFYFTEYINKNNLDYCVLIYNNVATSYDNKLWIHNGCFEICKDNDGNFYTANTPLYAEKSGKRVSNLLVFNKEGENELPVISPDEFTFNPIQSYKSKGSILKSILNLMIFMGLSYGVYFLLQEVFMGLVLSTSAFIGVSSLFSEVKLSKFSAKFSGQPAQSKKMFVKFNINNKESILGASSVNIFEKYFLSRKA
ncbi:hypothetical protein RJG79_02520 [Mycoplasmatota bacterium WC44]